MSMDKIIEIYKRYLSRKTAIEKPKKSLIIKNNILDYHSEVVRSITPVTLHKPIRH
jgi:hypothetical protein